MSEVEFWFGGDRLGAIPCEKESEEGDIIYVAFSPEDSQTAIALYNHADHAYINLDDRGRFILGLHNPPAELHGPDDYLRIWFSTITHVQ